MKTLINTPERARMLPLARKETKETLLRQVKNLLMYWKNVRFWASQAGNLKKSTHTATVACVEKPHH